jgi:hypothetical protein
MEEVTEALREKYRRKKLELDGLAVFHPNANAQRAHTMFMVCLLAQL